MTDDDDVLTGDDLKAAQERWADPSHEPAVAELFSRPAYGPGFRGDVPLEKPAKHSEVRPLEQETAASCGAAALRAVAQHFGLSLSEAQIRDLADTDPDEGTAPEEMLAAAQKLGLRARAHDRMSLEDLEAQLAKSRPVIICMQATGEPAKGWAGGHWVVATAAGGGKIKLADSVEGTVVLSREELGKRWHDAADSGRPYVHFALILDAPKKKPV